MLHPSHAHLLAGAHPVSGAVAGAQARALREEARRYHPAAVFRRAVVDGLVRPSQQPTLFRYRIMGRSGEIVSGVAGEVSVRDLLPHERTKETGIEPAPPAEIRPILVVTTAMAPEFPDAGDPAVVTEGGLRHEVTVLEAATGLFAGDDLVIADGHHRARAVAATRGPDARILALVVGGSGRGLTVGTFHRRFDGITALPASVADVFSIEATQRRGPTAGSLLWVQGTGERFLLHPRPEALESMPGALLASAAAVASSLLYPRLGAGVVDAGHIATARAAVAALEEHQAALLMPAPPMSAVLAAATAGTLFPPKATRFSPKPVRGLITRPVEAD
jgi:hypothetical protein